MRVEYGTLELAEDGKKVVWNNIWNTNAPKKKIAFSLGAVLYAMLMANNLRKMTGLL